MQIKDMYSERDLICSASCDQYSMDTVIAKPRDKERSKCPGLLKRVKLNNGMSECGCRGLLIHTGIVNDTCVECPPGSYGSSRGNQLSPYEDNVCKKGLAGTYRASMTGVGSVACHPADKSCVLVDRISPACPAGEYTDTDRTTECKKRPPGTFTHGVGDTKCLTLGSASEPVMFDTLLPGVVE